MVGRGLAYMLTVATLGLTAASCSDDEAGDEGYSVPADKVAVELTIRMKVSTLANEADEEGSTWENYIDMHGNDYRIYFFNSTASTAANNTLIAELEPTSVYSNTSGANYVTYTVRGELDGSFTEIEDFKVVVAANWGTYPETTPNTTTMQALCEAGTYSALVEDLDSEGNGTAALPSSSRHIPFYGVQDYEGVTWELGHTTSLTNGITMVRAMAKVEVVVQDDERTLSGVTLNRYNAEGYCAPLAYSNTSTATYALHLLNGTNDSDEKTLAFVKTQERATDDSGTQYETWTAYVPEYDNSGTDFCTITATFSDSDSDAEPTTIYFGQYTDGTCDAYETGGNANDRFNIERNYCYRFTLYDMTSTTSAQGAKGKGVKGHSQAAVFGTTIERNEH